MISSSRSGSSRDADQCQDLNTLRPAHLRRYSRRGHPLGAPRGSFDWFSQRRSSPSTTMCPGIQGGESPRRSLVSVGSLMTEGDELQ